MFINFFTLPCIRDSKTKPFPSLFPTILYQSSKMILQPVLYIITHTQPPTHKYLKPKPHFLSTGASGVWFDLNLQKEHYHICLPFWVKFCRGSTRKMTNCDRKYVKGTREKRCFNPFCWLSVLLFFFAFFPFFNIGLSSSLFSISTLTAASPTKWATCSSFMTWVFTQRVCRLCSVCKYTQQHVTHCESRPVYQSF